jgi:mannose-6-phosphate isomerase
MSSPSFLGPVTLEPIFQERIWGVDQLPGWYRQPGGMGPIGEVWLTAETCTVTHGPLAGKMLAEITREHPTLFAASSDRTFPLLMKTLLPREKLSVQVHPNDAEAQLLGQPRGKTECWYVLSAEPGATVAVGTKQPMTTDELSAAIESKTLEDHLRYLPVQAGDMVFVDAGTIHAIGPGMVVLETQEYSDITYRLYDYGRPRELHVEAGLAVSKSNTKAGLIAPEPHDGFTRLVTSDYFVVDRFTLTPDASAPLGLTGQLQILVALGEGCTVIADGLAPTALPTGTVVLLPAEPLAYTLHGTGEVIRISQP